MHDQVLGGEDAGFIGDQARPFRIKRSRTVTEASLPGLFVLGL
jgi:hypothetical protein